MTRLAFALAALALAAGACGGSTEINDVENPMLIPGGGVGEGEIRGELNVFAIDEESGAPIAGATVRVGEPEVTNAQEATTDAAGLVTFLGVNGPQTITITAPAHITATWFGANGAVVTIGLRPVELPPIPTARASGTIAGWSQLPAPAMGHYRVALVLFTWSNDFGDRANNIPQQNGPTGLPSNICLYSSAIPAPCNWSLITRTGPQAHFAIIYDGDFHATPANFTDDTYEIMAFGLLTGLDLAEGDDVTGESIPMIPTGNFTNVTVTFGQAPAGLEQVGAVPLLQLGAEGQVPLINFPISGDINLLAPERPTHGLPALIDDLASASYDFLLRATPSNADPEPNSNLFLRDVILGDPGIFPAFPAVPTNLSAAQGTYSFTPAAGASIHIGEFQGASDTAWTFAILDARSSFTLPMLTPDPLPAGDDRFSVSALTIPGLDLQNFSADEAIGTLTAVSTNAIDFPH